MIQLDTVSFTLFELAPVPYEVYMKSYGCSNTVQVIIIYSCACCFRKHLLYHLLNGGFVAFFKYFKGYCKHFWFMQQ
jgi:hypothetical protein